MSYYSMSSYGYQLIPETLVLSIYSWAHLITKTEEFVNITFNNLISMFAQVTFDN